MRIIVAKQAERPTPSTPPTPKMGVGGVEGVGYIACIGTIYAREPFIRI